MDCFVGKIHRSTSELDLNRYDMNHDISKDDKKKRGRSPFKYANFQISPSPSIQVKIQKTCKPMLPFFFFRFFSRKRDASVEHGKKAKTPEPRMVDRPDKHVSRFNNLNVRQPPQIRVSQVTFFEYT